MRILLKLEILIKGISFSRRLSVGILNLQRHVSHGRQFLNNLFYGYFCKNKEFINIYLFIFYKEIVLKGKDIFILGKYILL